MAKMKLGILNALSGTVGSVNFYTIHNKGCVRSKLDRSKVVYSSKQLEQQARMLLILRFIQETSRNFKVFPFISDDRYLNAFNYAFRKLAPCFNSVGVVLPYNLVYAEGDVYQDEFESCSYNSVTGAFNGVISCTLGMPLSTPNDVPVFWIANTSNGITCQLPFDTIRNGGRFNPVLPGIASLGDDLYIYISFALYPNFLLYSTTTAFKVDVT